MPRGKKNVPEVYVMQSGTGFIKIGIAKNVGQRYRSLTTGNPDGILILGYIIDGGYELETALHRRFYFCNLSREGAGREWFYPHPELIIWMLSQRIFPKITLAFLHKVALAILGRY